jgi:NADP-dependent aldehyde dehydrogenase
LRLFATLIEEGWWLDARIDHADTQRKPIPKPDVRSMLVALGPVAVFGASNFPLAFSVAGGDTASALAAGCPVIVKTHEGHPGTSELVGLIIQQAAQECGAPEGVFSLLHGLREVGIALVKHPSIKAVGFTGSARAGRALMDAAAARPHPIPVYAEMGSVNPVFVLRNALAQRPEEIATGLHASVTLGVGQFCTNPGLVFIEGSSEKFLSKLQALMAGTSAGVMLTASIRDGFRSGVEKMSKASGVCRLVSVDAGEQRAGAALFVADAATFLQNHELSAEVFGPSTLVVECASRGEMLAAASHLEGQLTATVHAAPGELDANRDLLAILETKAGRILCNGFPTGVEVCHAMNHGGPYPATSDGRSTSVGTRAITRFARPVCFQDFPDAALPDELKEANPLGITRLVDGRIGQQ